MCEDTRKSDIGDAVVVNEDVFNNNQRGNLFFIFVCGSISTFILFFKCYIAIRVRVYVI